MKGILVFFTISKRLARGWAERRENPSSGR
jgi:hypothetical protein